MIQVETVLGKRLAWLTDVHLNFVGTAATRALGKRCGETADACIITGDIAESHDILEKLDAFSDGFDKRTVYFVLGNHDFYSGSIESVSALVKSSTLNRTHLKWLNLGAVYQLASDLELCGVDGWYDGQLGNPEGSNVFLNDWRSITELFDCLKQGRLLARLRGMGLDSAERAKRTLALTTARRIIFATHVPPFREASTYEGKVSNDDYLPWFTNKALGCALRGWALANPKRSMLVLCGHSHGESVHQELPNLVVRTAAAEYGKPEIAEVFEI